MAGPIEQFEIKPLFSLGEVTGYQIVFTNSLGGLFLLAATVRRQLVPSRAQSAPN